MTKPISPPFSRRGPDALLLHLLQATGSAVAHGGPDDAAQKLARMFEGIKKYQDTTVPPIARPHPVIWQQGSVRLLHPGAQQKGAQGLPILLIPSLINGWEILDLMPGLSFVADLKEQGFDVYIVDWGDLPQDTDVTTMDRLLLDRLAPIVGLVSGLAGRPIAMAGYCMGGLLMAGVFPFVQQFVNKMVFLATPWDFHAGDPRLTKMIETAAPSLLPTLSLATILPNSQIQSLFAMVDPDMAIQKYSHFAGLSQDSAAAARFVAVEDWLQTGRDLPRDIAQSCIRDWYLENKTARGRWEIDETDITPRLLARVPTLVVAPSRDQLVERQTALALHQQLGRGSTCHQPDSGHIGMMASPKARDEIWRPITTWLSMD